jgi:aromatic ring-cleaving dioxygenase
LNLENNGILPNEELNIDLIPLNILTREQFIDLIKSIVGNKILLIQLKQINQLDQQIKAITGEIEYDHGSQKFWINEQIGIINEYIINSD